MAKDKILSEIKEAEQSAAKMVDEGLKNKSERIIAARAEAREIIKQAETDAAQSAQNALKSAEETIKHESEDIISKGVNEAKKISDKAEGNVDKAVENLVTEFERTIHA
ncbi:MAG: ATP synthase archaeal subunit H [Methanococcoides sp.]|jgi:V/A-type H+/Na+-transporting ATPase subunit G/H|nr:ATP synthase archaeal subunit H [Methanococcoides sp.]MCD4806304.1 ATP synthase archaeal subunit H [Methanococcoides sp.]MCD4822020.1 ATP synthase archaeal subunit H [Methanococcoides sp.]